jgi:hypothetical protein
LWETHQVLKAELLAFARQRLVAQTTRRDEPREIISLERDENCITAERDAYTHG